MPFAVAVLLIGFLASFFLGLFVAIGWVEIRARVGAQGRDYAGAAEDLAKAWGVIFGLGMVTTVGILAVFWMTGVDLGRMV